MSKEMERKARFLSTLMIVTGAFMLVNIFPLGAAMLVLGIYDKTQFPCIHHKGYGICAVISIVWNGLQALAAFCLLPLFSAFKGAVRTESLGYYYALEGFSGFFLSVFILCVLFSAATLILSIVILVKSAELKNENGGEYLEFQLTYQYGNQTNYYQQNQNYTQPNYYQQNQNYAQPNYYQQNYYQQNYGQTNYANPNQGYTQSYVCPQCGAQVKQTSRFCDNCGTPLQ